MKHITILGSTGSIGTQALDVCRKLGYQVVALGANKNIQTLEDQAREFSPRFVAVSDLKAAADLKTRLADTPVHVLAGEESQCAIAALEENDIVLNSIVGIRGFLPTLAALEQGKDVALANKETIVAGGKLVTGLAREKKASLYPVDSEHSAIFQCLQGNRREQAARLILTASGGPFRGKKREELRGMTPQEALRHPNWSMGAKLTVDSSTMMNKGLEFIEAHWLFEFPPEKIQVVLHPQSIVHSMVEYDDGAVIAQLGSPDMRLPIQYALTWPERLPSPAKPLTLDQYRILTFEEPDLDTFTPLADCMEAIRRGGLYPCIVNAANEEAVSLFLKGKIPYLSIMEAIRGALEAFPFRDYKKAQEVLETDREAREFVRERFLR